MKIFSRETKRKFPKYVKWYFWISLVVFITIAIITGVVFSNLLSILGSFMLYMVFTDYNYVSHFNVFEVDGVKPRALYQGKVVEMSYISEKPNKPEYEIFYWDGNNFEIVRSKVPIEYEILTRKKHPEYFL